MNCEAVDCETPAFSWICLTQTPTSSVGSSCGAKCAVGVAQPAHDLQPRRVGERLEDLEQLVGSGASVASAMRECIAVSRFSDVCATVLYIGKSRYHDWRR